MPIIIRLIYIVVMQKQSNVYLILKTLPLLSSSSNNYSLLVNFYPIIIVTRKHLIDLQTWLPTNTTYACAPSIFCPNKRIRSNITLYVLPYLFIYLPNLSFYCLHICTVLILNYCQTMSLFPLIN